MKSISYKQQVLNKHQRAFDASAMAYDRANREVIAQPSYWAGFEDSVTYRRNGEVVRGAFRNIKDLYNLGMSQQLNLSKGKATYSWNGNGKTPVQDVYFGKRTPTSFTPGRRWTEKALQRVNLGQVYADNL